MRRQHLHAMLLGTACLAVGAFSDCLVGYIALEHLVWPLLAWHVLNVLLMMQGLVWFQRRNAARELGTWLMDALTRAAQPAALPRFTTRVWIIAIITLMLFPGFGILAVGVATVIQAMLPLHAPRATRAAPPHARASFEPHTHVTPLISALHSDDLETRRAAIAEIGVHPTPALIGALRDLVRDPEAAIRNEASVTLTRLDNDYTQKLNQAAQQAQADDTESLIQLGDAVLAYVASNLLDPANQLPYLAYAQKLLAAAADDARVRLRSARLHWHLHDYTKALSDMQAVAAAPAAVMDYPLALEIAFAARAWSHLQGWASAWLATGAVDPAYQDVLQTWAHVAPQGGGR